MNIVEEYDGADKALPLRIQDWAGSGQVGFGAVKYSLTHLRSLQDEAFDAMYELGLAVGCGVDEEVGRVELTLSAVTDEALRILAELDPADDAILVQVGKYPQAMDAPAVTRDIQPGGEDGLVVESVIPSAENPGIIQPLEPAPVENAPRYDLLNPK